MKSVDFPTAPSPVITSFLVIKADRVPEFITFGSTVDCVAMGASLATPSVSSLGLLVSLPKSRWETDDITPDNDVVGVCWVSALATLRRLKWAPFPVGSAFGLG